MRRQGIPALKRPMDLVYFSLLAAAGAIGYFASIAQPEDAPTQHFSRFEAPAFELPEPDLKLFAMPVFKPRTLPRLHLSDQMETVLREVRQGLLASAIPVSDAGAGPASGPGTPGAQLASMD